MAAAVLGTTACLIVVVDIDGKITGLNPAGVICEIMREDGSISAIYKRNGYTP